MLSRGIGRIAGPPWIQEWLENRKQKISFFFFLANRFFLSYSLSSKYICTEVRKIRIPQEHRNGGLGKELNVDINQEKAVMGHTQRSHTRTSGLAEVVRPYTRKTPSIGRHFLSSKNQFSLTASHARIISFLYLRWEASTVLLKPSCSLLVLAAHSRTCFPRSCWGTVLPLRIAGRPGQWLF